MTKTTSGLSGKSSYTQSALFWIQARRLNLCIAPLRDGSTNLPAREGPGRAGRCYVKNQGKVTEILYLYASKTLCNGVVTVGKSVGLPTPFSELVL